MTYWPPCPAKIWVGVEIDGEPGELALFSDGSAAWFKDGRLHRTEGPAVKGSNGIHTWSIGGKECTEEVHRQLTKGSNTELLLLMGQGYDEYIAQRFKKRRK